MKWFKLHISVLILFFGVELCYGQNNNEFYTNLNFQEALLQESKTADDVYIIKSRIDKLSQEAKTLGEKTKVRDAYLLMSDKFAMFNHFKSGVLVYFNYLEIDKQIHQIEVQNLNDSIRLHTNNQISQSGNEDVKVQPDEAEFVGAGEDKVSESVDIPDSSRSFEIKWVMASVVVIIIMLIVFLGQRKKITAVNSELLNDKAELKKLFRISANVSMLSGAIRYAREFSAHCSLVLNDLIEITNNNKETATDSTKASQAVEVFKRVGSGDNKAL
ncbi:MAG: hypothetical protein ACKOX7_09105 [Bacteroidota bacterium]